MLGEIYLSKRSFIEITLQSISVPEMMVDWIYLTPYSPLKSRIDGSIYASIEVIGAGRESLMYCQNLWTAL